MPPRPAELLGGRGHLGYAGIVAKRVDVMELPVAATQVLAACRRAFSELGWSSDGCNGERRLHGYEDATKLCCHQSPASVEIDLQKHGGGTKVRMSGSVAGLGPVSTGHLRSRLEALWRHILGAL